MECKGERMKIRISILLLTALSCSMAFSDTTYYYTVNPDGKIEYAQEFDPVELPGRIDDLKNRDANLQVEKNNHQKRIDEIAIQRRALQGEMGALVAISTSIVISTTTLSPVPEVVMPIEIVP